MPISQDLKIQMPHFGQVDYEQRKGLLAKVEPPPEKNFLSTVDD